MADPLDPRAIEAQDPRLAAAARISELDRRLTALERRLAGEPWHELGAVGEPALAGSWAATAGAYATPAFRLVGGELLALKGAVNGGSSGSTIFTLPAGYRPSKDRRVAVAMYDAGVQYHGMVKIDTAGVVTITTTSGPSGALDEVNLDVVIAL